MKKTGPPGPRPRPRVRRVKKKETSAEQYTLYHQDVRLGNATYRVFLRVPLDELQVVVSAAVAAHLRGKKDVIVGVHAEARELLDEENEYVTTPARDPVKKTRRTS